MMIRQADTLLSQFTAIWPSYYFNNNACVEQVTLTPQEDDFTHQRTQPQGLN